MQPVMVKTCRKVRVASMIASKHTADTITHKFYHLYQAAPEQKAPLQQILKIIIIFQIFSPFVMMVQEECWFTITGYFLGMEKKRVLTWKPPSPSLVIYAFLSGCGNFDLPNFCRAPCVGALQLWTEFELLSFPYSIEIFCVWNSCGASFILTDFTRSS